MTDDKKLMEQDLTLEYRINKTGGVEPQITLDGLWLHSDVGKMFRMVMKAARQHKLKLLRERVMTKVNEPELAKTKEKKDGRKQKRK